MNLSPNTEIHVPKGSLPLCEKTAHRGLADLLVSVRDQDELLEVRKSAVKIIDLKEPRLGPLAPADESFWRIADQLWQQTSGETAFLLSAALGEQEQAKRVATSLPGSFAFAKVGPSGCGTPANLCALWDQIRQSLSETTELVAVAYADWKSANCLPPDVIFRLAGAHGFKRCLIDTYKKDGKSTVDHLGYEVLNDLHQIVGQQRQWWTLAGSIRRPVVDELQDLGWLPDCFGIRGDVCLGTRTTRVDHDLVQAWCKRLSRASA